LVNTEFFDGTSWTEVNDLSTAKSRFAPSTQSATSAFAAGNLLQLQEQKNGQYLM
jgi:hypothetical protein